jgi:hypothetical protein
MMFDNLPGNVEHALQLLAMPVHQDFMRPDQGQTGHQKQTQHGQRRKSQQLRLDR